MTEVIIYSQNDCPPCQVVKMFLDDKDIDYREKNISNDDQSKQELINTYQAYSTPTVVVGEEVIIGFDLKKLEQVLNI